MMHSALRNGSCLCARRKGQGKDDHGQNWVRLTNQLKRENDFERLNLTVFKTDIRAPLDRAWVEEESSVKLQLKRE